MSNFFTDNIDGDDNELFGTLWPEDPRNDEDEDEDNTYWDRDDFEDYNAQEADDYIEDHRYWEEDNEGWEY